MRSSTFPRSGALILGSTFIESLLPSTLISQADSLLESHRIDEAIHLADQQRRRLQGKTVGDPDEEDELRYVYQRIGFQCFTETRFEDAGNNFFAGDLDPRVLVSYYPDLSGAMFMSSDEVDLFSGVVEHMPGEASVDDIITNYSPHLAPNTRDAAPTAELRKILGMTARDMLERFLRRWRKKRERERNIGRGILEVVDTVLAKIFARADARTDLYALLNEPNDVVLSEIEPVLLETCHYNALYIIYKRHGDDTRLLLMWSRLADGKWTDPDVPDPLTSMFNLLSEKRDRMLNQQWGVWLTKRDPERGLKLLMSKDSSKRKDKPEDELALLEQIRNANAVAGAIYLEHLVLTKRSTSQNLHMQLATSCVDRLLACLEDEAVSKLWRAKAASYASGRSDTSFLSYFASTTPDSEHKRVRLQTILFLQGSTSYDMIAIRHRLLEKKNVLKLELAIVEGKLGNHRSALSILVHELRDGTSAEAYCNLGGEVVPAKIAQSVGERCGLQQWAAALFFLPVSSKSAAAKAAPIARQKSVMIDEGWKKELLTILLEVYMSDNDAAADRTTRLLNSQAVNLDVVDVVPLVPPDWPVYLMSSFLARSFRRTLHAKHEGQIVKAISAGQNLEVKDRTWLTLREHGALVEEAADEDDQGSGEGGGGDYAEKNTLNEKIGLIMHSMGGGDPIDRHRNDGNVSIK